MLTNLVEGGKVKCLQYWPDSDSKNYGPFEVTVTDKQMFADYSIRVFQIEVHNYGFKVYKLMIAYRHDRQKLIYTWEYALIL